MGMLKQDGQKGKVIRNKEIVVQNKIIQIEGIDLDETYSHNSQMDVIQIFYVFEAFQDFKVYQIDFKLFFLNGNIMEQVYIEKMKRFMSRKNPNIDYQLQK